MKNASLIRLFRISLRDMLQSYPSSPVLRFVLSLIFALPTLRFAYLLVRFNRDIYQRGLKDAAGTLLKRFYRGVAVYGKNPFSAKAKKSYGDRAGEQPSGGLLVLANHPGIGDSLALLSVLDRRSVHLVVSERDFFYALPALGPYLILVSENPAKRNGVIRAMLEALHRGEAVVLYPAGEIEADPFLHPESPMLKQWSSVIGLLIRLARQGAFEFSIVSALCANVLPPRIMGRRKLHTEEQREVREKRAVGKIIGLGAAKHEQVVLLWGFRARSSGLPDISAAALTDRIMNEVINSFHRCFPVGKGSSFVEGRRSHAVQELAVGS